MASLLCNLIQLYVIAIIGVALLSFFRVEPGSGLSQVQGVLRTVTDPVLLPVRRAMAPLMRGMPIDLSPIVVILGLGLLRDIIC